MRGEQEPAVESCSGLLCAVSHLPAGLTLDKPGADKWPGLTPVCIAMSCHVVITLQKLACGSSFLLNTAKNLQ